MTYGQLYREVWLELHPGEADVASFMFADSVAPSSIKREIPPEKVDALRKEFLKICRKIDSQTQEENNRYLNKHLEKN